MKIIAERTWESYNVRDLCVKNNWYTRGTNKEYTKMLNSIDKKKPTLRNMTKVAQDIVNHSMEGLDVPTVLFYLERCVVFTYFKEV